MSSVLKESLDESLHSIVCRSCQGTSLRRFLDLGDSPIADGLVSESRLAEPDDRYPLEVAICPDCSLVQILETVPPEVLFCQDYPYFASFSDSWLEHNRKNALELIERHKLGKDSHVVEIASNDGYLLKNFAQHGIPVLGIDPAEGPAEAAEKVGVPTMCTFFNTDLATQLRNEGRQADIILGNNVLAHVADTVGFVDGLKELLKPSGEIVIEVPYVRDLIEHSEFDTIYHQHLCYFSVTSLDALFRSRGLYLNEVRRLKSHGGSLRLFINHDERPTESVKQLLREEQQLGVDSFEYYENFGRQVQRIGTELRDLLEKLKAEGKTVVGYGAAAKACTLLNYAGIGTDLLDYVVDRNVHKHGRYMPGVRQPIKPMEEVLNQQPDYVLLLVWNLAEEILAAQQEYRDRGGKFIIPIPSLRVV